MAVFSLVLAIVCAFGTAGCGGERPAVANGRLVFPFKAGPLVSRVTFTGNLDVASSTGASLKEGAWGQVKWLEKEGAVVQPGDPIATIDMSESEGWLVQSRANLRHSKSQVERQQWEGPLEVDKQRSEVVAKSRDHALRIEEQRWLQAGPLAEDLRRAQTDLSRAALELGQSREVFGFKKQVAAKGFESAFAVRSQEIEVQGKEIEVDYGRRRIDKLGAGPLPEELARARYQTEVASGEVSLARLAFDNASVSQGITVKNIEFDVQVNSADCRQTEDRVSQSTLKATSRGMVIHPTHWGGKIALGDEVWEGLIVVKVVATTTYQIDAGVDESVSSLLTVGATASVRFQTFPGHICPGKVVSVGKSARRSMRRRSAMKKFPILVNVEVGSLPVRLGYKADVTVDCKSGEGVFLPRDVVRWEGATGSVSLVGPWGVREERGEFVPFDEDWVEWRNPPAQEGMVAF